MAWKSTPNSIRFEMKATLRARRLSLALIKVAREGGRNSSLGQLKCASDEDLLRTKASRLCAIGLLSFQPSLPWRIAVCRRGNE